MTDEVLGAVLGGGVRRDQVRQMWRRRGCLQWVGLGEWAGGCTLGLGLTGLGTWPGNGETLASGRGGRGWWLPGRGELSKGHEAAGLGNGVEVGRGPRQGLEVGPRGMPPPLCLTTTLSETPLSDARLRHTQHAS